MVDNASDEPLKRARVAMVTAGKSYTGKGLKTMFRDQRENSLTSLEVCYSIQFKKYLFYLKLSKTQGIHLK